MRLHLVACSGTKLTRTAFAKELYIGDLFKASRAYAEAQPGPWAILSALHGLVDPYRLTEPYDLSLADLDRPGREAWAVQVDCACLSWIDRLGFRWTRVGGWAPEPPTFVLLAGHYYTEELAKRMESRGWNVELPLAHKGIGQQRQWLRREVLEPRLEASA